MRRLVFVVVGVLLAMVVLSVGCAPKATPAPAAALMAPTQNVMGILESINTPLDPGPDAVTIRTPQGLRTFPLSPDAKYYCQGEVCPPEEVQRIESDTKVSYDCTVVYDVENTGAYDFVYTGRAVYFAKN